MTDPGAPAHGDGAGFGSDDGPPRRSKGRIALLVALGLVVLLAVGAVGGLLFFQSWIDKKIERFPDPFEGLSDRPSYGTTDGKDGKDEEEDPVTFLLLGSDSRISAGDPEQWEAGGQRTDAMMIAQVSGDRDAVTVMSIPRDSWVPIPGHGEAKINAAFSFGGPALAVETVEELTGVPIDHVAIADFESFAALTDELGGVNITLDQPLTASGETLEPGTQHLDGEQALQYARERKNVEGGDFGRVQRQQNWMRAIMSSAFHRDVLSRPNRLVGLLETVSETIAVDENLTISTMRGLALDSRDLRPDDVHFITAPNQGTGRSPDGAQSTVVLDDEPLAQVSEAFADGTIDEFLEENPDIAPRLGDAVN